MKTLKPPLLWIGAVGALVSFSTFGLLWSGHLQPIARLADTLHVGDYVFPFLAFIFLASISLVISGIIFGIFRLRRRLNENKANSAGGNTGTEPASKVKMGNQF